MKKRLFLISALTLFAFLQINAQRFTDKLDRGIVAIPATGGYLVSWRIFGEEYYDTKYTLYRNDKMIAENLTVSNYTDAAGGPSSKYSVEAFVNGVSQGRSATVQAWANNYKLVKVEQVTNRNGVKQANGVSQNPGGDNSGYCLNDISLADVNGDGLAEFIVKRNNCKGNLNQPSNTTDFNQYECYTMEGKRLWWIDLGPNLMSNPDEQYDMIGYDWDRDGKAECIMRGADNMIIHTATGKTINIGDMTFDCGKGLSERPEYVGVGAEYLLYLNGETGEPYGWDGSDNWTPMAFPLPRFESNETVGDGSVWGDVGHRATKIYMAAPYFDGRNPSIFLGRGCYTRHKMCALDVNPDTHEITQRWRWNCYDGGSVWFGNGFHNFQIADVDLDGRDEVMFGSMVIDDTGYGLATTGLGHGDAQHCGDLDPYRWGQEQFTCQEGSQGNSFWCAATGEVYYRKQDGGDDGRAMAGNFTNDYPGGQGKSASSATVGLSSCRYLPDNGISNLDNRIFWDGDLLDEMFDSKSGANRAGTIIKWGGKVLRNFTGISNNWTKCNPSAQGDILGDWREELVLRLSDNTGFHIYPTTYATEFGLPTLWHDHQYRNAMAWQCVGYNQPPHPSFFVGELEGITQAPPPLVLRGRTELSNGTTVSSSMDGKHLLLCSQSDAEVTIATGAKPWIFMDNAAAWVQGTGDQQATRNTPKRPARTIINYMHTIKGAGFSGTTRVVKQGEGILVLPNVEQTHTGNTDVWNGTLVFDGTLTNSPLWLNRHTKLVTAGGKFQKGIRADYNATIEIGENSKSTLTASTLALNFGSRVVFDLYNDLTCDQIMATTITLEKKDWKYGPKYLAPVFEFRFSGEPAEGRYLLAEAAITGEIGEVVLEGIETKRHFLEYSEGKLYLVVEPIRNAAAIAWQGGVNNIWDFGLTKNFLNNGQADYASLNDDITFDDNAAVTDITIRGQVRPKSLVFNNETKDIKISGISENGVRNEPSLTKNGAGKTTINGKNYMGNTVINAGTLEVDYLSSEYLPCAALGTTDKTILLTNGATLAISDEALTEQILTIDGEGTLDVAKTMTFNKGIVGKNGGILHKAGSGTLTTASGNTIKRLVIDNGRVDCGVSNNVDQLPDTVEFVNGVLWGRTMDDLPGITNNANFVVPEGCKGTYYASYRGGNNGKLKGKGEFTAYSGGIRCVWNGDWSEFEGTVIPALINRQAKPTYDPSWDWSNGKGLPKATLQLNDGVTVNNNSVDLHLGGIKGWGTLAGSKAVYVGANNEDINFQGTFSGMAVVKEGDGTWTIDSNHKQLSLARLFIMGGTVYFNALSNTSSSLNSLAPVTVRDGATMEGTHLIGNTCIIQNGGTLKVGKRGATCYGEMKFAKTLNLQTGSKVILNIQNAQNKTTSRSYLTVGTTLTINGEVEVTMADSYQPAVGDSIILWTANSLSGTPTFTLPQLPEGMEWNTDDLKAKTGILRVVTATSIAQLPAATEVSCTVYALSGQKVGEFRSQKGNAMARMHTLGLPKGSYVVCMKANGQELRKKITLY